MVVRMIAVLAVFVVVMIVPMVMTCFFQEVRVDVQLGIEVETAQIKHVAQGYIPEVHTALRRTRVHVLDAVGEGVCHFGGHQISLADVDLVSKTHLATGFLAGVELGVAMFGVDQGEDGVEQILVCDVVVHEEGLRHGAGVGQAGGFDHDTVERQLAVVAFDRQIGQGGAQIFTDGATDTAVVHLDDLLLRVGHEDVVVDVFFTEFVFDDGNPLAVGLGQDALEQRRFAAAQKAGKNGDRNQAHSTSVVLMVHPRCHRVALFLLCLNYDTTLVSEPSPSRAPRADRPHGPRPARDRRSLYVRLVEFLHPGPDSTAELIEALADAEHRDLIEPQSRVMLEGVIRMADMTAGDVMVATRRMDLLDIQSPYDELLAFVINTGHSRFPVFDGGRDNIIGVLMSKDLLKLQRAPELNLRTLLRPPMFVPESKGLNELLREFRTNRSHLAIVIDEFGRTAGLITIEDVLEEIVGEIEDEFDDDDADSSLFTLADGSQRVAGDAEIHDVNEVFGTQLPVNGFDTIGGLVAHELGRVPRRGEVAEIGGLRLTVMLARGGAVRWFKVTRLPTTESAEG
jgi:magnesium and cobalt transporter